MVFGEIVDTFQNIDFTSVRPVGPVCPPRRPDSTAVRHVQSVHDDHSTCPDPVGVDSNGFTTTRDFGRGIDFHDGVSGVVDRNETFAPSGRSRDVVDGTVGRVIPLPEPPRVEKVLSGLKGSACSALRGQVWLHLRLTRRGPIRTTRLCWRKARPRRTRMLPRRMSAQKRQRSRRGWREA